MVRMNIIKDKFFLLIIILFSSFSLSSCNLITGSGQSEIEYQDLVLYDGVTYGQSFYAKHNGLQSFNIFIQPDKEGNGDIIVRLRSNKSDKSNLELIQINRNSIKNSGYYNFQFSVPHKSYLKGFFVLIDYDGSGSVIFWISRSIQL